MLSSLKRKSLPEIPKLVGLENPQGLQHFINTSPWEITEKKKKREEKKNHPQGLQHFINNSPRDVTELRKRRIERRLRAIRGRKIFLIVDETGDPKKGNKTDYTARQYLGKLGKVDRGIVAVTTYGVLEGITFPILFEVYKPQKRLKQGDSYQTKTQIAARMVREIVALGFEIEMVLADSLYGESETTFIGELEKLQLNFIVAIRNNHGVWMPKGSRVRTNKWRKFDRTMSYGMVEERYKARNNIWSQKTKEILGNHH